LVCDHLPLGVAGQRVSHLHYSESKALCSRPKFLPIHSQMLQAGVWFANPNPKS
jgi:hypothetical protein